MQFDYVPPTPYLAIVLNIIRKGIEKEKGNLKSYRNEKLKNQRLVEAFNIFGANDKNPIFVQKENVRENNNCQEDMFFHLPDDNHTRIFYIEAKRLPKTKTVSREEYVLGLSTSRKPAGGIERYKLGLHGEPHRLKYNGIIAYVENKTIAEWETIINYSINSHYPEDLGLQPYKSFANEYKSFHSYSCNTIKNYFKMYHFWIDLTQ